MRITACIYFVVAAAGLSAHAFPAETCTPYNSYYEDVLPPSPAEPQSRLPVDCVWRAQANLLPNGYYGFCASPEGAPGRTHPRPCLSEKYVRAMHSALVDVSECLGYDVRWAFASFNLESALHMNAVGAATDVGVGQLTRVAIDQINNRALGAARQAARLSSIPACWRLASAMNAHGSDVSQRCGFMNAPDNPRRNLIYSILLLKENRKIIDRLFLRFKINLPQGVNQERLKLLLTKLSYNAGAAGLVSTLAAYAKQMGPRLTDHHFHFENKELSSFTSYLNRHFPVSAGNESTRKRVSKYIGYVITSVRKVDSQLGGNVCIDAEMFPPLGPHPINAGREPDPVQADRLVRKFAEQAADDLLAANKIRGRCAEARTEFEFAFVPQGLTPEDLPEPLVSRYKQLCRD